MQEIDFRHAADDDLPAIWQIEREAGELFRAIGFDDVADDDPVGAAEFGLFVADESAWVAVAPDSELLAYILVEKVDTSLHIEQVTVRPSAAGRRTGSRLIDLVGGVASRRGLRMLTLTTFREVPWNAPYYVRLGFRELPASLSGPELSRRMASEDVRLGGRRRVAMGRRAP